MIELFPHQKKAIEKLHNGCILWAGTGVGKSITALAYFCEKECDHMKRPRDLLIITTARKRDTLEWEGECAKMDLVRNPSDSIGGIRVRIDSWNNIHKYIDTHGEFIIFDEQRVSGTGPWASSFLKLTRHNHWIMLSATPGDRWMEYCTVFVANGFYRNKTDFKNQHVIYSPYVTKYPKIIGYRNEELLYAHRDAILVGMHYDKQTEQHHKDILVEYDRHMYNWIAEHRFNPYTERPIRDAGGLCLLLRRVVNESVYRIAEVERIMRSHPKVIIFYNFDYELDMLREISCHTAEWNGHRHDPLPEGDRWAYFVQYTAGAEGWNCISTDTMIFFSRSYSYKQMTQAAGRIDRINTAYHDLYYYYLTTDSGIDRAISKALSEKKDFNESAYYDSLAA